MTSGISLRQRLRIETRAAHDRLDHSLSLIEQPLRLEQYARLLVRFHAFHRAIEPRLEAVLEPSLLAGRSKLGALLHDLDVCGTGRQTVETARQIDCLPAIPDRPSALGALYVVEGSTLGGQVVSKHLLRNPQIPQIACRYFNVYGNQTAARWRAVCGTLDASSNVETDAATIRTAASVFDCLDRWLDPATWRDA